jgi:serine/threonine protein kinase
MLVGTYPFMSPELFRGDQATPGSDVFALGCVLVFAATGHPPFEAETAYQVMYRILEDAPDLGEIEDGPFRAVAGQCLAKDPRQRPSLAVMLAEFGGAGPAPVAARALSPVAGAAPPPEAAAGQESSENNENVTITQVANVSPGGTVIQIAGNAKIGDGALPN